MEKLTTFKFQWERTLWAFFRSENWEEACPSADKWHFENKSNTCGCDFDWTTKRFEFYNKRSAKC